MEAPPASLTAALRPDGPGGRGKEAPGQCRSPGCGQGVKGAGGWGRLLETSRGAQGAPAWDTPGTASTAHHEGQSKA